MCTGRINCARKPKTLFIIEFYWLQHWAHYFSSSSFRAKQLNLWFSPYPFRLLLVLLTWMNHSIRHSYTNWITCYGIKVFFLSFISSWANTKKRIDLQWISKNKKTTFWLMMIIIIECTQIELLTYIWHRSICVL